MVMSYRCISMLGRIIGLDGHFDDLDGRNEEIPSILTIEL